MCTPERVDMNIDAECISAEKGSAPTLTFAISRCGLLLAGRIVRFASITFFLPLSKRRFVFPSAQGRSLLLLTRGSRCRHLIMEDQIGWSEWFQKIITFIFQRLAWL